MFRTHITAFLAICIVLSPLTVSVAHAGDDRAARLQDAAKQRLRAADSNQDGYIDRAEAEAGLPRVARRFDEIDSDGDGRLASAELDAAVEKMRQARSR